MKKNFFEIIVATIFFILLMIIINLISMTISISKYKSETYYTIGEDKIPSIYQIVGKRKLSKYKSYNEKNIEKYKYKYIDIKNISSDLSTYTKELKDNYNFIYTSDIDLSKKEGSIELSTNSFDKNKIIIIEINYNKNYYEIIISKGKGKINLYE